MKLITEKVSQCLELLTAYMCLRVSNASGYFFVNRRNLGLGCINADAQATIILQAPDNPNINLQVVIRMSIFWWWIIDGVNSQDITRILQVITLKTYLSKELTYLQKLCTLKSRINRKILNKNHAVLEVRFPLSGFSRNLH